MLFCATGRVVGHETFKDEWHIIIKAYKFTVFEILRDFLYCHILCCLCYPYCRVYQLYDTGITPDTTNSFLTTLPELIEKNNVVAANITKA